MRVSLENQCHPTLPANGQKDERRKFILAKFNILQLEKLASNSAFYSHWD